MLVVEQNEGGGASMIKFLLYAILLALCWPIALLVGAIWLILFIVGLLFRLIAAVAKA
ncbi:hypothetical protein [Geodermatophilus sp. URMC 63]